MNKSQIIIGTSSWGSKISCNNSIDIGKKLYFIGLNYFDTAPTYGGGYSHYILNKLALKNKVMIDTKYGQLVSLSFKEISKRIYRFINFSSFKKSFETVSYKTDQRNLKDFWNIKNIDKHFDSCKENLKNCEINTFYLHNPPFGILNKSYLQELHDLMKSKNVILGISGIDMNDLDLIINNFPSIKLQVSLDFFFSSREKIVKNIQNLNVNGLFRDNKYKNNLQPEYIKKKK